MGKQFNKKKGPRGAQNRPGLNENELAQITSKIEHKLSNNDQKRKVPPTEGADGKSKRQRGSEKQTPKNNHGIDKDVLLAEIRGLGGDEADLELINGVESEDEAYAETSKQSVDKSLQAELLALSKELGFSELAVSQRNTIEDWDEDEAVEEDSNDEEIHKDPANDEYHKLEEEEEEGEGEEEGWGDEVEEDSIAVKNDGSIRKVEGLVFQPRADWHATKLAKLPSPFTDDVQPFIKAINSLQQYGKSLLDVDAAKYRTTVFAASSHKFLSTIMTSGTLTDKISALTLASQESPVHNIRAFETLLSLGSKKSRAQAIGAIGALIDMLGPGTLLPSDRRLRTFPTQPGLLGCLQKHSVKVWASDQRLPGNLTEAHLIMWVYEDWLKETYFKIIQLLEVWCADEIEYSRMRALDFVYALLKDKPEQESNLLTLLVNKLGDRDRKIASRASYLLLQLQNSHPGMKPIIVRTVEQEILLRPSQDHRARYYAINTLNQTILTSKETALVESLLRVYFDIFITLLKTGKLGVQNELDSAEAAAGKSTKQNKRNNKVTSKDSTANPSPETEAADKLVSALLTGVNRAAPFAGTNDSIMERHIDTLFKIAHSANFNTGIQALLLIQHISLARNLASDRFYRTLYESLLDPRLVTSSKQALYLNLLLRSLKNDLDVRRVKAFAKRMLQISGLHQPPFVCGLLYVLSHLRQTFPDLSTLIDVAEETEFDDDEPGNRPIYDGRKRHPEASNAHRSCLWEMIPIQSHFHPAVMKFAISLLDKNQKMTKPDLESHSLIRFLDKFVYRQPKSSDSARGVSIMQPLRATKDLGDIWLGSGGAGSSGIRVNSAAFWKKKVENIAAEDVFFHEYFQHASRESKESTKQVVSGYENDDEDQKEDEIWKALVSTQPDIDGEDSDGGFSDLDDLDMGSEDGSSPALSLDEVSDDDDEGGVDLEGDKDELEDGNELMALDMDDDSGDDDGEPKKGKKEDKRKERKKMLKALPMFASVDDYAELLAGEEEM